MIKEWTLLESNQLFKDRWADIKVETWQQPNGKIITPFYKYGFPNYTCAVAITKQGNVILERIFRQGLGVIANELPGGCVNQNEYPKDAIARELKEETGYVFEHIEYLGVTSANPTTNSNVMHMFLATGGEKKFAPNLDFEEEVDVFEVSIEEMKRMLYNDEFIQAMQCTAIYKALVKLNLLHFKQP